MSIDTITIKSKAAKVTMIFNTLSWVILIFGGIGVALSALTALIGLFSDEPLYGFGIGLLSAVVVALYTALMWAWITMAVIIAGYISNRS